MQKNFIMKKVKYKLKQEFDYYAVTIIEKHI